MKDNQVNTNGEIDLAELVKRSFNSFWKAVSSILIFLLRSFSYLIYFGLKRWIILCSLLFLGACIGLIRFYSGENLVLSDMIIKNNEVTNDEIINILSELNVYATQKNAQAIAQRLNTDTITADALRSIDGYWFVDNDYDGVADYIDDKRKFNQLKDTTLRRIQNILNIRVRVSDPSYLAGLEKGLTYYLSTRPLLQKLNSARISSLKARIEKISTELDELDRLQNYEYFEKQQKADLELGSLGKLRLQGEEKDTRLLHEPILELQDKKLQQEKELNVYGEVVTVLTGFARTNRPEHSATYDALLYGIILCLCGYILLFTFGHRKLILTFLEDNSKQKA